MSDEFEKPRDDLMREVQVARDEEHAGRVEGNPWDELREDEEVERL